MRLGFKLGSPEITQESVDEMHRIHMEQIGKDVMRDGFGAVNCKPNGKIERIAPHNFIRSLPSENTARTKMKK